MEYNKQRVSPVHIFTAAQRHAQLTLLHLNLKKLLTREHNIEFLRFTVLEFQALKTKVPERPFFRPSVRLELSPLQCTYTLGAPLFFHDFCILC